MKALTIALAALSICLFSCKKTNPNDVSDLETLKKEATNLHKEIKQVSNQLEVFSLDPSLSYHTTEVATTISSFNTKRTLEKEKISKIKSLGEDVDFETLICADFEDMSCFVENWDIQKTDSSMVSQSDTSYGESKSLHIQNKYTAGAINIPGVELTGYVNGIESQKIYKIRFWAKYSGYTAIDNGPAVYMAAVQDGVWLGDLYLEVSQGQYENEDWRMYSFQIASRSNSPLEVYFGSNIKDCYVDDIHIVKKEE